MLRDLRGQICAQCRSAPRSDSLSSILHLRDIDAQSGFGAVPAVSRNVEHDAVWIAELVLGTGRSDAGWPRMVFTALSLNPLLRCVDIVYPDAEVVHADEVLAPFIAGVRVGLELQQRHGHHSV